MNGVDGRPPPARARVRCARRRPARGARARAASTRTSTSSTCPAQSAQPSRRDRAGAAARACRPRSTRAGRCSSPTPTAAPAARSTRCSREFPGVQRLPGAHCYEVFAGAERVRGAARRGARHLLPHRLPRQALRRARVERARARPPSRAARRLLRRATGGSCCSRRRPIAELVARARAAAARLGLAFVHRPTGRDGLRGPVLAFVDRQQAQHAAAR